MNKNLLERKIAYIALHQVFVIAMVISVYTYDYTVTKYPQSNEIWYLVIALITLFLSILALLGFMRVEKRLLKHQKVKKKIDKLYVEVPLFVGFILLFVLKAQLDKVVVSKYALSGLMITVGTLGYLFDVILVNMFVTVYRRILRKELKETSILYKCWHIVTHYKMGIDFNELSQKAKEQTKIKEALEQIAEGHLEIVMDESSFSGQELEMAIAINRIQEGLREAVEEKIKDERMKADLITNVSHDIKTPLTSIVNYVELLKREHMDNANASNYIRIISDKAQRLKQLTEDLVEVSKISSGNIKLEKQMIDFLELLFQTGGEFNERFEQKNLTIVTKLPANSIIIEADGRQLYRALENLYTNAAKYALENSKVYVELGVENENAIFTIKNLSNTSIDVKGGYEELTERFVRGERSRTTEGSGLGLSITKNLVELMGGTFTIKVEGELFVAQIMFPLVNNR